MQVKSETETASRVICITFEDVSPINTIEDGIARGHYDDYYKYINNRTVPLKPASGSKKLYLVCFNEAVGETEYPERLRAIEKKPCNNGPNYMLGLMAKVPEGEMPQELYDKDIVVAKQDDDSVFIDGHGAQCYMHVPRNDSCRKLDLISVEGEWDDYWVFLAEDL